MTSTALADLTSRTSVVVHYIAEPKHVREVTLTGSADLALWKRWLASEGLKPVECEGRARVIVMAATMRFLAIQFSEISFAVSVASPLTGNDDGDIFLLQAFNSRRTFAWCERTFFATPYAHGDVRVGDSIPASAALAASDGIGFQVSMSANSQTSMRQPIRSGEEGWTGRVFLPARGGVARGRRRYFFAKVRGAAQAFRFEPERDRLSMVAQAKTPLRLLLDSNFTPREWLVRPDGEHGKSRTFHSYDWARGEETDPP